MTSWATALAVRRLRYEHGQDTWVEQGAARAVCFWLAGSFWFGRFAPWHDEMVTWQRAR